MRSWDENNFWALLLTLLGMVVGVRVVVTITTRKRRNITKKSSLARPPGPWKLPIIGNLHQLLMKSQLPPHRLMWELSQEYGPVMRLQLGELDTIVVSSAEAAEQVMKTHDVVFASRTGGLATNTIFYAGKDMTFAPYGEHWRQMRKHCMVELFSAKRVLSFRPIRIQEVSSFVASISSAKGQALELKPLLLTLTKTITSRSTFGKPPKLSDTFIPLFDDIVSSIGGFRLSDLFPSLKFIPLITGFRSKLLALHRAADAVLDEVIDQHLEARRRQAPTATNNNHDQAAAAEDLVDVLLNLQQNPDLALPLTMDSVKGVLLNVFIGGTDTAAIAIEWIMSALMKYPSVMQRAQTEVRGVFSDDINEEGLHQLEYLTAVIKETFRLYPTGPLLFPKDTAEDVEITGFEILTKCRVIVNLWAIGRDPRYWNEPEKFDPDRFLNSAIGYKGTHFGFLPFGAGRRMCPGIQFATTIIQLTIANLLFHFDWELPHGMKPKDLDMTEIFDTLNKRKQKLCLIPRAPTTVPP